MIDKHFFRLSILIFILQIIVMELSEGSIEYIMLPYFFFIIVLWVPVVINIIYTCLIAFCLGFIIDMLQGNPGFCSSASIFLVIIKKGVIKFILGRKNINDYHFFISRHSIGAKNYFLYVFICSFNFFLILELLEFIYHTKLLMLITRVITSSIASTFFLMIFDFIVRKKEKSFPIRY